jgi:hypothetical protein
LSRALVAVPRPRRLDFSGNFSRNFFGARAGVGSSFYKEFFLANGQKLIFGCSAKKHTMAYEL